MRNDVLKKTFRVASVSKVVSTRSDLSPVLFLALAFVLQVGGFGSGRGGIRTLDTPFRDIAGHLFVTVRGYPKIALLTLISRRRCRSLLILVCGGLVY